MKKINISIAIFSLCFSGALSSQTNTSTGVGTPNTANAAKDNSAFGFNALNQVTTGFSNTGIGANALIRETTGIQNSGIGCNSLSFTTTGNQNTALGYAALFNNSTGSQNVAIGNAAGRFVISGGNNNVANNSIFIGHNTRASVSGNTNEIVIGSDAQGEGSNTIMLGSSSIVETILNGNVGVGTTTPGYKLEVAGDVNATGLYYYGDNKRMFQYSDSWLRINPSNHFASGIYCGTGILRTDGIFQVGSVGSRFIVNTNGNTGVGTASPTQKIDVNGKIRMRAGATAGYIVVGSVDGTMTWTDPSTLFSNNGQWIPDGNGGLYSGITGNIGVGGLPTCHKLTVEGSLGARSLYVHSNNWCDYVFEKEYELTPLHEVENYINKNGHLKEIPTTAEVMENGINVAEMNAKLLLKVEELTLYLIEMNKKVQSLEAKK